MPHWKNIMLFYREKYIFLFFNIAFALFIVSMLWILWGTRFTTSLIPLHYNIFFGIDRVGTWFEIFKYPFESLAIICINFILGYLLFTKDKYLSYYLALMGMICMAVTFLYLIALKLYLL